jgi:hypothetical protein
LCVTVQLKGNLDRTTPPFWLGFFALLCQSRGTDGSNDK